MKKLLITFFAGLGISTMVISCGPETTNQEESAENVQSDTMTSEQMVERGEYLVNAIGCDDCHTPKIFGTNGPVPDMERRFSGHPAALKLAPADIALLKEYVLFNNHFTAVIGPWGASFAANISSDPTGIGNWEEENFLIAIKEGKNKGMMNGRPLLPPMPWHAYKNLSDEDLKSIFAYLKSTTPVNNLVPAPIPFEELQKAIQ